MAQGLSYRIIVERKVAKEAEKIPLKDRASIDKVILSLAAEPRPPQCKKLTDRDGYRIRKGNYRILYTVDDKAKAVVVYRIKVRSESTYR